MCIVTTAAAAPVHQEAAQAEAEDTEDKDQDGDEDKLRHSEDEEGDEEAESEDVGAFRVLTHIYSPAVKRSFHVPSVTWYMNKK